MNVCHIGTTIVQSAKDVDLYMRVLETAVSKSHGLDHCDAHHFAAFKAKRLVLINMGFL